MSIGKDIERLNDLCLDLSSQAKSLTTVLLANDKESVGNLQKKIEEAVEELGIGIKELEGYVSTMETQKNYWS